MFQRLPSCLVITLVCILAHTAPVHAQENATISIRVPFDLILHQSLPATSRQYLTKVLKDFGDQPFDLPAGRPHDESAKLFGLNKITTATLLVWLSQRFKFAIDAESSKINDVFHEQTFDARTHQCQMYYGDEAQTPTKLLDAEHYQLGSFVIKDTTKAMNLGSAAASELRANCGMVLKDKRIKTFKYKSFKIHDTVYAITSGHDGVISVHGSALKHQNAIVSVLEKRGITVSSVDNRDIGADVFIGTLFHEARHSDGHAGHQGFHHARCPKGHDFENTMACDTFQNGANQIQYHLLRFMAERCSQCSKVRLNALMVVALAERNNIVKQSFEGYIPPNPTPDPLHETILLLPR